MNVQLHCILLPCNIKSKLHLFWTAGCIDSSYGGDQVNTFMTALNMPQVSKTLLKRHDWRVGPGIEAVAHESCAESILLERTLTESSEGTVNNGSDIMLRNHEI